MESTSKIYPQFNQLIRRFGNTRGRRRQKAVMEAFLYSHSTWVRETVDEMLESTKRKKVRGNNKPRKRRKRDKQAADRDDGGVDCERRDPSQQPGRGDAEGVGNEEGVEQGKDGDASAPGRRSDEEAGGDGCVSAAAELEAIETSINGCSGLHGYQKVDTKIAACRVCKKRYSPLQCQSTATRSTASIMWRRERRSRRVRRPEGINATDGARRRQRNSGTRDGRGGCDKE